MNTVELKISENQEIRTGIVFWMIQAAIETLEKTQPANINHIKVYVPFWFNALMDFEAINNQVVYYHDKSTRLIFGHEVVTGYEDSIVIANTSIYPHSIIKISRP